MLGDIISTPRSLVLKYVHEISVCISLYAILCATTASLVTAPRVHFMQKEIEPSHYIRIIQLRLPTTTGRDDVTDVPSNKRR